NIERPEAVFTAQALGGLISILLYALVLVLCLRLDMFGLNPKIAPMVERYLEIAGISILPMLLFQVYKEYLQAWDRTVYANALVLVFNIINVALNAVMMFGLFGVPEMGIDGAAWATVISRS